MLVGSEAEMMALGASLSVQVRPGDVFRLIGPLGAGKTTFTRGFIRALGFAGDVRSPTFNLIHEYSTSPPVCHADLFRLDSPQQVADLGLEDYLASHVLLVEWADLAGELLPNDATTVTFASVQGGREVTIS